MLYYCTPRKGWKDEGWASGKAVDWMDEGRGQIYSRQRGPRQGLSSNACGMMEVSLLTCFQVGSNPIESTIFCFERQILFKVESFRIFSASGLLSLPFFPRFRLLVRLKQIVSEGLLPRSLQWEHYQQRFHWKFDCLQELTYFALMYFLAAAVEKSENH